MNDQVPMTKDKRMPKSQGWPSRSQQCAVGLDFGHLEFFGKNAGTQCRCISTLTQPAPRASPLPFRFWRLREPLRAESVPEMHFGNLGEIFGAMFRDKFFGGFIHCAGSSLREFRFELFFQSG